MNKFSQKELDEAVFQAKIRENIHWWNRTNWLFQWKYDKRITELINGFDDGLRHFKLTYEGLRGEENIKDNNKRTGDRGDNPRNSKSTK